MANDSTYRPEFPITQRQSDQSGPPVPTPPSQPAPVVPVGPPHPSNALAGWNSRSHAVNSFAPDFAPQRRVNQAQQTGPSSIPSSEYVPRPIPQTVAPEAVKFAVKPVISRELPVDYRMLLLSLADQYIASARTMSLSVVYDQSSRGQYHKLIATGLGCVEQVTRRQAWSLAPRVEAAIQLRYATLLYEETENVEEVEQLLGKGIVSCDRNRLFGIKYSMQSLLVKLLFKTNRRASIKMLDGMIRDSETCQHIPWIYVSRFLRVSLCLQNSVSQEYNTAIVNLRAIASLSKQHSDAAVRMAALILEASVHLRARKGDWITDTQQALASARALQTIFLPTQLPQLQLLTHLLDLACSLDPYDPTPAKSKMQGLLVLMQVVLRESSWETGGTFVVPVNFRGHGELINDAEEVFPLSEDNQRGLAFSWLTQSDVTILGHMISAAAMSAKKLQGDASKCEQFLNEGLDLAIDERALQRDCQKLPLTSSFQIITRRLELRCYLLLQLTAAECNRSDWTSAHKHITMLRQLIPTLPSIGLASLSTSVTYFEAAIFQGIGNFDAALQTYERLISSAQMQDTMTLNLAKFYAILASMNSLLIIRAPVHPLHHQVQSLLALLQPHFEQKPNHPTPASQNQHLVSAYSFLLAVLPQSSSQALHAPYQQYQLNVSGDFTSPGSKGITSTKFHLQTSLTAAKRASNALMATLCLCYTNHFLYQGIVSDQAIKAAKLAEAVADQAGVAVWVDFAKAWTAETLLRQEGGDVVSGS